MQNLDWVNLVTKHIILKALSIVTNVALKLEKINLERMKKANNAKPNSKHKKILFEEKKKVFPSPRALPRILNRAVIFLDDDNLIASLFNRRNE